MDFSAPVTVERYRVALRDLPSDAVREEFYRLENSVQHLRRSNAEMMREDPDDADFRDACKENEEVVLSTLAKMEAVKTELLRRGENLDGRSGSSREDGARNGANLAPAASVSISGAGRGIDL